VKSCFWSSPKSFGIPKMKLHLQTSEVQVINWQNN
jgi:hypothetical protein